MSDAKKELTKHIARRKLEGGEFSYVLKADDKTVEGKKAALSMFKELQSEAFSELKSSCKTSDETDDAFESRLVRLIPSLPFEDTGKDDAMEVEGENKDHDHLVAADMHRVVRVDGVEKKASSDDFESYICREFEGVEKVKAAGRAKGWKVKGQGLQGGSQSFDLTFKDEEAATKFLEKEVKYKEQVLKTQLLKTLVQWKIVRRQFNLTFTHNLRLMSCIPLEKGKEDNYLLIYGIGRPTDEEIQEYFLGLESEFENVVSAKTVLQTKGENAGGGKILGILVQFEDKAGLEKFTQLKDVKYKDHALRYNVVSKVTLTNELRTKKANFSVDDGPTTQELANRRLVVLRLKDDFSPEIQKKLKSQFPEARDVRHCSIDRLTILTFPSAEVAAKAVRNQDDSNDLFRPVNIMQLSEFLEIREKILEEEAERIEKTKTKYENIKNSCVTVDGNVIKISVPQPPKALEKKGKKEDEKKEVNGTKKKDGKEEVVVKAQPLNPILKKRVNRGKNAFDIYVGVRGFNQHIRNMGKATDMDICNYFIHNHKDVADVKFVNWTDIVFAKFKSAEAAERFISLSYHMFYGIDLNIHDVVEFLKKKTDQQKEEVARVLLGKKFNKNMIEGRGGAATPGGAVSNGSNGAVKSAEPGKPPEVELAAFATKQAGEGIRELFIENLHLDNEMVGEPRWMKSEDAFKARIAIKLDENAIGYLVKKWNDLEITVDGEAVKAELTGGNPVKEGGGAAKRGRRRPNNPSNKRPKISLEDY